MQIIFTESYIISKALVYLAINNYLVNFWIKIKIATNISNEIFLNYFSASNIG